MPRTMLTALLLLAGLLAGCGDDGDDDGGSAGSATPSSSAQPTASAFPSDVDGDGDADGDGGSDGDADGDGGVDGDDTAPPPFPADTQPDTQQASADAFGNVTQVRIGHHDGFDRVVFEFGGPGTPGWDVRYVDQPTRQGSGEPVDLAGGAALQVAVTGVGYPPDTGVEEYPGPRLLAAAGTEAVTEVFFDGTFEGVTAAVVGTQAETPFRVYLMADPTRIVLEVADGS